MAMINQKTHNAHVEHHATSKQQTNKQQQQQHKQTNKQTTTFIYTNYSLISFFFVVDKNVRPTVALNPIALVKTAKCGFRSFFSNNKELIFTFNSFKKNYAILIDFRDVQRLLRCLKVVVLRLAEGLLAQQFNFHTQFFEFFFYNKYSHVRHSSSLAGGQRRRGRRNQQRRRNDGLSILHRFQIFVFFFKIDKPHNQMEVLFQQTMIHHHLNLFHSMILDIK
jgi:hypothetical protein